MSIGFLPSFFFHLGSNGSSFFLKLEPAQALGLPSPRSTC